ncbi:MAG: transcription termination/antitermination protein NusG [Gemmatimonadota bacterium]
MGAPEARWYAIQTYAGHENKVKSLVERRIAEEPGSEEEREIRRVLVPTQDVVEIKGGKRVMKTRRLYPGYVLVEMVLNERTLHIINNLQGVIKFVGAGVEPQALRPEEVNKILGVASAGVEDEVSEAEIPFRSGQVVEVTEGPFKDFSGTVEEVFHEKGKVKVQVSIFGRPTAIELDYTQLKGY